MDILLGDQWFEFFQLNFGCQETFSHVFTSFNMHEVSDTIARVEQPQISQNAFDLRVFMCLEKFDPVCMAVKTMSKFIICYENNASEFLVIHFFQFEYTRHQYEVTEVARAHGCGWFLFSFGVELFYAGIQIIAGAA